MCVCVCVCVCDVLTAEPGGKVEDIIHRGEAKLEGAVQ